MSTKAHDGMLAADPLALEAFDHDWTLAELLPADERPRLLRSLAAALDGEIELVDGAPPPVDHDRYAAAIQIDFEPLGWLLGPPERGAAVDGIAELLRKMLLDRQRYRMASALHMESVQADFAALRAQHEALQQSENRYRDLAAQLEVRVAEQVSLIEVRQRQLYQAERLASVAQLAAGMAHEINNPIGFVRSNLNSARAYLRQICAALSSMREGDQAAWERIDADFLLADFAELIDDSIAGADRIATIIRDLKGFSNVDRDEVAVIDLRASLEELCRLLTPRLPELARLHCEGQASPRLRCRPGHLQQALHNVLDNAIKAIGPGGRIAVRCACADGWQQIEVSDDGCGIAEEHLARVFDPFYTTRAVGSGIGLGLTLARDVILAEGGRITLSSRAGEGTTVDIRLPLGGAQ